jgi:hypothetical protein
VPTVNASEGDTLCGLAIAAGFLNCQPLRDHPANSSLLNRLLAAGDVVFIPDLELSEIDAATDSLHSFVKESAPPFSVRFTHGSPDRPYLQDLAHEIFSVSTFVTNRGGLDGGVPFPTQFEFHQSGHVDPDTFKVEVVDPQAGGSVTVVLEALKPIHDASGTLVGHQPFSGAERDRRKVELECKKVRSGVAYRSKYLRLVVDDLDKGAVPEQTLLTTDFFQGDPQVEILDQNVRATYVRQTCPAPPDVRCRVSIDKPLDRGKFVDLSIRVLRATPTGVVETSPGGPGDDGVVLLDDVEARIKTFCRQYWAQAQVKFRIVRLETVDLPSNMLTVSDATANLATATNSAGGTSQIGVTISVQRFGGAADSTHTVGPMDIPAGNTPEQTANLIRDAINSLPRLSASVSLNPPEVGLVAGAADATLTSGSADIVIKESSGGRVTLTNLTPLATQDTAQHVAIANVSLNLNIRNQFGNYHVGHPEERNLYKMLDTGDNVIDIFVLTSIPGLLGFTLCENKHLNANRQAMTGMKNTVALDQGGADGTPSNPYVIAHELGHILLDNALHADSNRQLMVGGFLGPPIGSAQAFTNPKRLTGLDPTANNWDQMRQNANGTVGSQRFRMNARRQVRETSGHLLQ